MSYEDLKAELEQLRRENAALRREFTSGIRLKVWKGSGLRLRTEAFSSDYIKNSG
jgi:hypothetical protein